VELAVAVSVIETPKNEGSFVTTARSLHCIATDER
jgi:hypothetical protein